MSELKARHIVDVYDSYYAENPFGERSQVYLKSEADKVIANRDYEIKSLKDSIGKLLRANTEQIIHEVVQNTLIYGEGFIRVEDAMKLIAELRHNKYKRCLAMAKLCEATALWCYQVACTLPKGFKATLHGKPVMIEPARLFNRQVLLTKWSNRWLELAEKFKEAK